LFFRNVKRDNRSVFLYAYENAEAFLSVELQIFFSSAERRTAYVKIKFHTFHHLSKYSFNEKMSKYRVQTNISEVEPKFDVRKCSFLISDQEMHRKLKLFPLLKSHDNRSIICLFFSLFSIVTHMNNVLHLVKAHMEKFMLHMIVIHGKNLL
jgi:hypothetical protein